MPATPRPLHPSGQHPVTHASQFRPHPWHGLSTGLAPPERIDVYIEITPFDFMKYEIDKESGYLRVDRPQRSSAQPPALYGFVPRTYCAQAVAALAPRARMGDEDPLDVCVLAERPITRNEIILPCRAVGGLQMIDGGQADDKIIAVLENDHVYGRARDLRDLPPVLVERLQHYFTTYKLVPGEKAHATIGRVYGRRHAARVIRAAMADYQAEFPTPAPKRAPARK